MGRSSGIVQHDQSNVTQSFPNENNLNIRTFGTFQYVVVDKVIPPDLKTELIS